MGRLGRFLRLLLALPFVTTPIAADAQRIVTRPAVLQAVKPGLRTFTAVTGAQLQALSSKLIWLGNSIEQLASMRAHRLWGSVYSGARFDPTPWNQYGNGGDEIRDMMQRLPAALVTGANVIVLGDLTNRTSGRSSADLALIGPSTTAGTFLQQVKAAGKIAVLTTTARNSSLSDSDWAIVQSENAQLAAWASADPANVWLFDRASVYTPNAGTTLTNTANFTVDGKHPSTAGAQQQIGPFEGDFLASHIVSTSLLGAAGTMLPGNVLYASGTTGGWDMNGTGGTLGTNVTAASVDGSTVTAAGVATGWTLINASSGATVTAGKGALASGQAAQIIKITGTATANPASTGTIQLQKVTGITAAAGSYYDCTAEVEVTGSSGSGQPTGFATISMLTFSNTSWGTGVYSAGAPGATPPVGPDGPAIGFSGILRVIPGVLPVGGAAKPELDLRFFAGTVDAMVKVGRFQCAPTETVAYAPPAYQSYSLTRISDGQVYSKYTPGSISLSGSTLTARMGSWSGGAVSYAYQWHRCSSAAVCTNPISGATAQTYVEQAADSGTPAGGMQVEIVGTNTLASTCSAALGDYPTCRVRLSYGSAVP